VPINTFLVFSIIYSKVKFNYINLVIIYLNSGFSSNTFPLSLSVTDLILAVVELLERDISRLVVEVREALEPVKL
jgi:hypothetical protein